MIWSLADSHGSSPRRGHAGFCGRYFTCTLEVNRMPFVSGLRSRAATAITAPMIVPYSMDVEAKQCRVG